MINRLSNNLLSAFAALAIVLGANATFAAEPAAQPAPARPKALAKELSRAEFEALLAKPEQLLIIDVRRPDELTRVGGFPVFLSVQIKELENSVAWIPKDRTIVTVSNHASRSGRAADLLASKGFKVAGLVGAQTFEEQGGKLTKFEIPVRTGGANAAAAVAPAQAPATNQ
jgi:rhodanese-related sulfurtransferase